MSSVKQLRRQRRVDASIFKEVMQKLEHSGLPSELQQTLNPLATGSPRQATVTVYLTALILVFRFAGTATLADVHRFLTTGLDRHLQVELSIRGKPFGRDDAEGVLSYRQVQYFFHQLVRRIDPNESDDGFERRRRRAFLARLNTEFARIFIPAEHLKNVPAHAVDSTPIHAWNLARSAVERDAGWGYRTKTDSDRQDMFYGFRALTYCHATERPYIEAFSVRPANQGEAEENIRLTTALAEMLKKMDGTKIGIVLADIGFSELQPQNWVLPMRTLGAEPVFDLKTSDRGLLMVLGAKVTDGRPYCPCLPADLERPARPPRVGLGKEPSEGASERRREHYERDRAALDKAKEDIRGREVYLAGHVSGRGYGNGDKWRCPALAGKIRCTRRPDSLLLPDDRLYLDPADDIEMGEFCTDDSIVLGADVQPKLRQRYTWMDSTWRHWYRKRTYAEGVYGNLKNRHTESIGRGWIRLAGLAATTLMLWAAVNHYNLRIATGDQDDGDYGYVDLPRPDTP